MAKTIISSFSEFASRVNITDRQEQVVSTCRSNVVQKLASELDLYPDQPSRLIGSYDRDTLPRYLSSGDVDVMVVLHYGKNLGWHTTDGTLQVLQKFRKILSTAYTQTPCGIDRNCVTLKLSQFRLDVVPAFINPDGSYLIPDSYRKSWLSTQPTDFSNLVTAINKNLAGRFVPFVKMIKAWNNQNEVRIRSFHLETILANTFAPHTGTFPYSDLTKYFFDRLPDRLSGSTIDPTSQDRLDEYLDNNALSTRRQILVARAKRASQLATTATNYGEYYEKSAIETWKQLFQEFFPAYG